MRESIRVSLAGRRLSAWMLVYLVAATALVAEPPSALPQEGQVGGFVELFSDVELLVGSGGLGVEVLQGFRVHLAPAVVTTELRLADTVLIELPGIYYRLAVRLSVEERPDGYSWRGRLATGEDVVLSVTEAQIAGVWYDGSDVYQLLHSSDGSYRVLHIDPSYYPPCATEEAPPLRSPMSSIADAQPTLPSPQAADKVPTQLDVMVLYTPAARDAAGGLRAMNTLIQNAIDITNTAYENSDIDVRLRLVHRRQVAYTEQSITSSLAWLIADADVAALRQRYGADMVSLLSNDGGACGVGYVQRTANASSFEAFAFQVTVWNCAVGNLSFAHELGHLQGCEHDPANGASPDSASYPYSFGHFFDGLYRTVMSYSNQCLIPCPRAPYFSNPDVSYLAVRTGVAGARDNHRTIENTALSVSRYRSPPTWTHEDSFESGDLSGWSTVVP